MILKKYILFVLIGLFAFSTVLPASNGKMNTFHYKLAKNKTSKQKKSRKIKTAKLKLKSPQSKKKKFMAYPFAY
jgi:hypothetical protein